MSYQYKTNGVCSRSIFFDLDEGLVRNVRFEGGCNGNLQGVARLAEGRPATEVASVLSGICCDSKPTSCPDLFARALRGVLQP